MKKFLLNSFFVLVTLLAVCNLSVEAQSINPNFIQPNNPALTYLLPNNGTNPILYPCNYKPDLYFTSFSVTSVTPGSVQGTGAYATRIYTANFTAVVKNGGGVASAACNLMPEFSEYNKNSFFYAGCQNFAALNAGATRTVTGTMSIRVPVSHHSAKVRLYIDSPCAEEFLPAYVKVNECNENNNYAQVLTINF